jgi:hypothetical protein
MKRPHDVSVWANDERATLNTHEVLAVPLPQNPDPKLLR